MSRGFVKEEDQEEVPMVPPRADLPEGVTNYVTQTGMSELLQEQEDLIKERDSSEIKDEKEKRIQTNFINAKLGLLKTRIASAQVIDLSKQPKDEVRFGASLKLKIGDQSKPQQFQIVGVDEADIAKGKISFISPIAKLLTNKKVGDKVILELKPKNRVFEILEIEYDS
ncbi:transcription elongation factor GreA [Nonlabens spongiae]|uniref:Transcription elongation factor GreA n=1 Tax=Nonlabens spongiae TaxID=331648 RepID=A0A1W6MPA9_9FLAO|nr:GreA/GreB family elongation factor [Nonlabens spongiae]ARN79336.1 transcription elongation factor GreA [Nonlabens spongiae]